MSTVYLTTVQERTERCPWLPLVIDRLPPRDFDVAVAQASRPLFRGEVAATMGVLWATTPEHAARLVALFNERSPELNHELDQLPRVSDHWFDLDAVQDKGSEETHRQVREVARRINAWFVTTLGGGLRFAHSSESGGGHLEVADLFQPTHGLGEKLLALQQHVLREVFPEATSTHNERMWEIAEFPNVRVDLTKTANRGKGGQFRLPGGRPKEGRTYRKVALSLCDAPRIDPQRVLAWIEQNLTVETVRANRPRKLSRELTHRLQEQAVALRSNSAAVRAIAEVLAPRYVPGSMHQLRMALSAVALRCAAKVSAGDWTQAIGEGWRDHEDAHKAWDSTSYRVRTGQGVRGAAYLVQHLGEGFRQDLGEALSRVTGQSASTILASMGGVAGDAYTASLLEAAKTHKAYVLERRLRRARRCAHFRQEHVHTLCSGERMRKVMHCDAREVCVVCAMRSIAPRIKLMRDEWTAHKELEVVVREYGSREAALKDAEIPRRALNRIGAQHPAQFLVARARPNGSVVWLLVLASPLESLQAKHSRQLTLDGTTRESVHAFLGRLDRMVSRHYNVARELVSQGFAREAVDHCNATYKRRWAVGPLDRWLLPFPDDDAIRAARQAHAERESEEAANNGGRPRCLCVECKPEDSKFSVVRVKDGKVVGEWERYAATFDDILKREREAIAAGLLPPAEEPVALAFQPLRC